MALLQVIYDAQIGAKRHLVSKYLTGMGERIKPDNPHANAEMKKKTAVDNAGIQRKIAEMQVNYADEHCELGEDGKLRVKILDGSWSAEESQQICANRNMATILQKLTLEKPETEAQKFFKEQIGQLAEEEKKRFHDTMVLQVCVCKEIGNGKCPSIRVDGCKNILVISEARKTDRCLLI
jgi:hypothetical protein